jgi:leucyl/phenylalanyl-tRNA--protein transferase
VSGPRPPIEPARSRFSRPDPLDAEAGEDLVAVGADLEPGTLLAAYRRGLFPMPVDPSRRRGAIAWYSPDPRGIIPLDRFHVSRTTRRSCRQFEVRFDTAFTEVMRRCGDARRPGRWINEQIVRAYTELFRLGWAHSVEVYADNSLVGGVYGVRIDRLFAGESMFHERTDASKVALLELVEWLRSSGATLFDVQWTTPHLRSLGAVDVSRPEYVGLLGAAVGRPER